MLCVHVPSACPFRVSLVVGVSLSSSNRLFDTGGWNGQHRQFYGTKVYSLANVAHAVSIEHTFPNAGRSFPSPALNGAPSSSSSQLSSSQSSYLLSMCCEGDTMTMPLFQLEILWMGQGDRIWTHRPTDAVIILRDQAEGCLLHQMNYIATQTNIPEGVWNNRTRDGDQMSALAGWYKFGLVDRTSAWKIWL